MTIVLLIVFTTTSTQKHMLEKGIERLTTAFLELKEESPSKRKNNRVTLLCIALLSEFSAETHKPQPGAKPPPPWVQPVLFPQRCSCAPREQAGS